MGSYNVLCCTNHLRCCTAIHICCTNHLYGTCGDRSCTCGDRSSTSHICSTNHICGANNICSPNDLLHGANHLCGSGYSANNNIYDRLPWLWCTNLQLSNYHYHRPNHYNYNHPCQKRSSQKRCQDSKNCQGGKEEERLLPLSISAIGWVNG